MPKEASTVLCAEPACATKEKIMEYLKLADINVIAERPWDIEVHNNTFYKKVLTEGSLGLGEAYMDGWWDCMHLDQFIYQLFLSQVEKKVKRSLSAYWTYFKARMFNLQGKKRSKQVIDIHYQLGNDLYEAMLDPLMVYSCGYWDKATTLAEAQTDKFDLICRKLGLQPGMKVLDIGCGWGGFVKYAAEKYGVTAVGITLSENQAAHARKICVHLPVEILIKDYRDLNESFDRIISIGMFEHVGNKNYRTFMQVAHRALKPGGLFLLHTIGRNTSISGTDPWIHKYIFPNGQLPSIARIGGAIEKLFVMEDWHNFGSDYDKTLMAWFENFDRAWPTLKNKYGDRFYRMWKYYLLSCAGGFRAREMQLWQL
ncbi:MAG: cyclopropane fatty acyl phospholipid synthase, partial [Verrucomicrobia bacterium]|nr:cyclopropane fatty acyl phospholipid synthase [Verrucomicrobiota bacterium]